MKFKLMISTNQLNNFQATMEHQREAENLLNKFIKVKILIN